MRGDRVEVVIDVGGGGVRDFQITARKQGRRVEVNFGRAAIEVTEVTRSGRPVRSARFMPARVVAVVEHPGPEGDGPGS